MESTPTADSHRYFALQPIFTLERRTFGYEALYRADWENHFSGDSDTATRTMIDNWLLYGFEDLTGGCRTFLNCTREALLSGFLTLLPPWAVFEILESVEPDEEVLRACRALKDLGYRISLDDFECPDRMAGFLELADFIKIDFRLTGPDERARLIDRVKETGATLIAEKIETEEEYRTAVWEGFQLFQGYYFLEQASFAMSKDSLNATNCLRILETLDRPGFAIKKLTNWIIYEPGLMSRVLRRANWTASRGEPVNSIHDALKRIGKREFCKMMLLTILTEMKSRDVRAQEFAEICNLDEWMSTNARRSVANGEAGSLPGFQGNNRQGGAGKVIRMSTPRKDDL